MVDKIKLGIFVSLGTPYHLIRSDEKPLYEYSKGWLKGTFCEEPYGAVGSWVCTRNKGHEGLHEASMGPQTTVTLARWYTDHRGEDEEDFQLTMFNGIGETLEETP